MFPLTEHVRAWLVRALRQHVRHGRFELAGGGRSDWYLDCRDVTYGVDAPLVAMLVDRQLAEAGIEFGAVGGVGYGGVPVALLVAYRRQVRSFAVRLDAKGHGRSGRVMGPVGPGDRVALVEDVFNTGSSVCSAIEALRAAGVEVAAVVCLVNRGNPALSTVYGDIPFLSVLNASELET